MIILLPCTQVNPFPVGEAGMPKKRYRPEEIIAKLREADVLISQGKPETIAFPGIGFPGPWNSLETPGGSLH
jgi:hypothetical protein